MQYLEQDVIAMINHQHCQAVKRATRALIIQPGAIGDCILTLPLARYMQDGLGLGSIDMLGHMDYLSIMPGRTCVDAIRSMELIDLHRLFQEHDQFELADQDPLIGAFADYTWIVSFLGEPGGSFEKNLIYTAMCSHSAEVICLPFRPPAGFRRHLSDFYIGQFRSNCPVAIKARPLPRPSKIIQPTDSDVAKGKRILAGAGIAPDRPVVLMHPGSSAIRKCWHIANFLGLAEGLAGKGIQPVFVIGPAEQERFGPDLAEKLRSIAPLLDDLSLEDVLAVLSVAGAFVGNDTGISHMAGGMGVMTFVVFGPTDPVVYRPFGPNVTVVRSKAADFTDRPSPALQARILDRLLRGLLVLDS